MCDSRNCQVQEDPDMSTPLIPKPPAFPHHHQEEETHLSLALNEAKSISHISLPMALTGLLLYSRSAISTLFLGRLGDLPLAAGSLALAFANITAHSLLSGLASGMEPICAQAHGAHKPHLLSLAMQRTTLLLLLASLPISLLWLHTNKILLLCGQEEDIASEAQFYLLYSLPDLIAQSILHPLRIYLRAQSITLPLTCCTALSTLLHVPINHLLVNSLGLGIRGVALSAVWTNFNLVGSLILCTRTRQKAWTRVTAGCFKGWGKLLSLSIPSCVSVCLEWWWYEIIILLCGLLLDPHASVASMGLLIQTTALIYIFPSSLSFGVSTRVGNQLGAGNPNRASVAALMGLAFSFLLGLAALAFALSVRNVWALMFTNDGKIVGLTSMVLPIVGLCEIGNCPQTTLCGVLRGTARPKLGANVNLGCFYLVGMPVAVWLAFYEGFDFQGLWLGMLAAQGSCMAAMLFVLVRTDWEAQARRATELTSWDRGEGVEEEEQVVEKWCLGTGAAKECSGVALA